MKNIFYDSLPSNILIKNRQEITQSNFTHIALMLKIFSYVKKLTKLIKQKKMCVI